jgi:hypothetical protein
MPDETNETTDAPEGEAKPTITIAERDGTATASAADKPTITIAERDGDE